MTVITIIALFFSIIVAGSLSFYHYLYKAKNKTKINLFLAFLRFLSIFLVLLLLINPTITKNKTVIVKTPLALVIDNSSSIAFLNANEKVIAFYKKIKSNPALEHKFEINSFQFSNDMYPSDVFTFKGKQTNIDLVAKNLKNIYNHTLYPTLLITDGNQTSGNDYVYSFGSTNKVFPVIVGDTTSYLDFKINQLNVNKYAFYKNEFPVETFLEYTGIKNTTVDFVILQGNAIISKQRIAFSPTHKTATVKVVLPADKIGIQVYKAKIVSLEKEKNTYNNVKNFAVEVIDQKTNIALISSINHPDLGALKRAIETNVQRKVSIIKPNEIKRVQDFNVFIFYQPTTAFKDLFDSTKKAGINTCIITGNSTDFNFLNEQQNNLNFKMSTQKEAYLALFNTQFNLFALENIGFENFPPLENAYGTVILKGATSVLLWSKIRTIDTQMPLLVFTENQNKRNTYLLGENSWKWRLQTHINDQSFKKYDLFIDKIIQFLSTNTVKKALVVEHELFYNYGEPLEITAQYFNKNYEIDPKARLTVAVANGKTKETKNYDLLKENNYYKVNLDGLRAGKYLFTVKELNSNTVYSNHFEVLDFDIEKQFTKANFKSLTQLAQQTQAKVYFLDQVDALIKNLLEDNNYKPIQKNTVTKTNLIDSVWLFIFILSLLSIEWFVRKYNGLL